VALKRAIVLGRIVRNYHHYMRSNAEDNLAKHGGTAENDQKVLLALMKSDRDFNSYHWKTYGQNVRSNAWDGKQVMVKMFDYSAWLECAHQH
jgi:hypothetical protein